MLYIQLHLYVIWSWLDFGVYRSRNSNVMRIILSQSFWNSKYLFIIAVVRSYMIFAYMGAILPRTERRNSPGWEEFFTISTFRKNMRCITENYIIKTLNEKFLFPSSDLRHALKIPLVFFFFFFFFFFFCLAEIWLSFSKLIFLFFRIVFSFKIMHKDLLLFDRKREWKFEESFQYV